MAADAKDRTGQGLSRLLNVVDGLIGQGVRCLVLVTTNEALGKLHPAVSRPGRCAAKVMFGRMGGVETRRWLEAHDLPVEDEDGMERGALTIAELFALREDRGDGRVIVEQETTLGFAS